MNSSPACLFPTTTILIDDDKEFLDSLQRHLSNRFTIIKTFDCAKKALDFCSILKNTESFADSWHNISPSDYDYDYLNIELRFSKIIECHNNPRRFDQIACIVVDHRMPHINGLEFLQTIPKTPAKKILLTAQSDTTLAVEAFNQGLIDFYVEKHDPQMPKKMQDLIAKFQFLYFEKISRFINESLIFVRTNDRELQDHYSDLVNKIQKENDVSEFYLTDANGSCIFFASNKRIELIIKSREQMEAENLYVASDGKEVYHKRVDPKNSLRPFFKAMNLSNERSFYYSVEESHVQV